MPTIARLALVFVCFATGIVLAVLVAMQPAMQPPRLVPDTELVPLSVVPQQVAELSRPESKPESSVRPTRHLQEPGAPAELTEPPRLSPANSVDLSNSSQTNGPVANAKRTDLGADQQTSTRRPRRRPNNERPTDGRPTEGRAHQDGSAPGSQRRRSPTVRVTASLSDDTPRDEPIPIPPRNIQLEDRPEIRRNEGDDRLTLNIQQSDIRKVLELLSEGGGLNILASKSVSGSVTASLTNVDINTALDAILKSTGYVARREQNFIFVGTPDDFKAMDQSADSIGTRVYRPNYVKAADVEALITPLLSEDGRLTVSKAAQTDIPVDKTKTGGDSFAHTDVVIVKDYERILMQLDEIVAQIDRQPMQVSIQAVILSVRLNDTNRLGVNFEALRDKNNVRLIAGAPLNNLDGIDVAGGGLKFGFLDASLGVFVDALETVGNTDVVASPRLMCLNKQRAEILIGSEFGYVSTTTVTENAATQAIDFLKVGTHLIFRPFISDDGMIRMEIHPELSTGSVRVVQGLTLPDKETTEVTTNILCPDGASVIIGGLIREDLGQSSSHIPMLGRMPLIGPIFRNKTDTMDRREIIVVLTPNIVCEPDLTLEAHQVMNEFETRSETFKDKMSPIGRRNLSDRYLRLARSAWNAGDSYTAFRYTNLAIHYNSLNGSAVQLRTEIISIHPDFDQNIDTRLRDGLMPHQHPNKNYSRAGSPWKEPGRR